MSRKDTIFALSSGAGRSAIAVVRVSGPGVRAALEDIAGGVPRVRAATLRILRDALGRKLDEAIVLYFAAPKSESGEDLCEFQVHGSRAVVAGLLATLGARSGFRVAEPGEFARRALMNGKMDLLDLEALGDLLDAETEQQRLQSLEGGGSLLRGRAESWREKLLEAMALQASDIDFSDEGDVPTGLDSLAQRNINDVLAEIDFCLRSAQRGERVRDGIRVVLVGAPNVGKSSLLNAIAGRDVAIVSEIAGTTRDRIDLHLDLGGVPIVVTDTAGIRDSSDTIEIVGVKRSRDAAKDADIVLALQCANVEAVAFERGTAVVLPVWTKSDVAGSDLFEICLSARTGEGIDQLLQRLLVVASELIAGEPAVLTRQRHVTLVKKARSELQMVSGEARIEVAAEYTRQAVRTLDSLVGRIDVEDVLGAIFSRFCIGK